MIRHIVYKCIPGSFAGGVQKAVFELAAAQHRLGADVEVWSPDVIRAGTTEKFSGLPIRYFEPAPAFGYGRSVRMAEAFGELDKDAVLHAHATYHPLNLQVGRAARRLGHRAFYHPHGALSPLWLNDLGFRSLKKRAYVALFERPNLQAATGIFALTKRESKDLEKLGVTAPLHVLPNGIADVTAAGSAAADAFRSKYEIPAGSTVMLFIGRIVSLKRVEDIIGALHELKDSFPGLYLVIAGEAQKKTGYASMLRQKVASLGLGGRVRWTGFLDENEKLAAYAAANVFVHASENEGMSVSILEAMSAGLPVVASQGCNMFDASKAGALTEFTDGPQALCHAVIPFLTNQAHARSQGAAGRAYVRRMHDWDAIARRSFLIYAG